MSQFPPFVQLGDKMEKCVLMVGYDREKYGDLRLDHVDYSDHVYMLADMPKAAVALAMKNSYLLIIVFLQASDEIPFLANIRSLTDAPIIVVGKIYNGLEKIAVIGAGADEYLPWPEDPREAVASCRALIRRYTVLNRQETRSTNTILRENIFIDGDCRKVFVQEEEIRLTRREFDLFCLLASYPRRVFTYEQLFRQIWEGGSILTENSVHSCIRRIRRKLEGISGCPCRIENMRGVGYFFRQIEP